MQGVAENSLSILVFEAILCKPYAAGDTLLPAASWRLQEAQPCSHHDMSQESGRGTSKRSLKLWQVTPVEVVHLAMVLAW